MSRKTIPYDLTGLCFDYPIRFAPCGPKVPLSTEQRILDLEREVSELRHKITVLTMRVPPEEFKYSVSNTTSDISNDGHFKMNPIIKGKYLPTENINPEYPPQGGTGVPKLNLYGGGTGSQIPIEPNEVTNPSISIEVCGLNIIKGKAKTLEYDVNDLI